MFKLLAVLCFINGECTSLVDSRGITYQTQTQCEYAAEQKFYEVMQEISQSEDFQSITIGCVDADFIPNQ